MDSVDELPYISTIELKRIEYIVASRISKDDYLRYGGIVVEGAAEDIIIKVKSFVYGVDEATRRVEIRYPADWWEAFKERWFPRWLLKRYPVKYHEETVEAREIYPTVGPAIGDHRPVVRLFRSVNDGVVC